MKKIIITLLILCLVNSLLYGGTGILSSGSTAGGVRSEALGSGTLSAGDSTEAMLVNPAALIFTPRDQLSVVYNQQSGGLFGGTVLYNIPVPGLNGTAGIAFNYFNTGKVAMTTSDGAQANLIGESSVGITAAYSHEFLNVLGAGGKLTILDSSFLEQKQGITVLADLGVIFNPFNEKLNVGAAVKNLSPGIKIADEHFFPAIDLSAGISSKLAVLNNHSVFISADARDIIGDNFSIGGGVEFSIFNRVALRAGADSSTFKYGLSYGLGVNVQNIKFNYALTSQFIGNSHKFSVTAELPHRIRTEEEENTSDNSSEKVEIVKKKDRTIVNLPNIVFDINNAEIADSGHALLNKAGKILTRLIRQYPRATVEIAGHTDNTGEKFYNLKLSYERAEVILTYLKKNFSFEDTNFKTRGYGEIMPVASNDTKEGQRKNRRVEFVIKHK